MPYKDPEKKREYARKWQQEHPEAGREASRKWHHEHPEQVLEKSRTWRQKNQEQKREYERTWRQEHHEQVKEKNRQRDALKRGATVEPLPRGWEKWMLGIQQFACAVCSTDISQDRHADHILPLSRGGAHTIENLQLLCPRCNLSKGAKTMEEWTGKPENSPTKKKPANSEESAGLNFPP